MGNDSTISIGLANRNAYSFDSSSGTSDGDGSGPFVNNHDADYSFNTTTEEGTAHAALDFRIARLSFASTFALELLFSNANCIPSSEYHEVASESARHGATLQVRKGLWKNQIVACKRLKYNRISASKDASAESDREYLNSLAQVFYEMRILSHKPLAKHRNIPQLVGFSLDDAGPDQESPLNPVMLVEWASTDLNSYLSQGHRRDPAHCASIVADIADGLQALHKYGISHADLKPANVLLYPDGSKEQQVVAKLSDFGLSGSEEHREVAKGRTPAWEAPNFDEYRIRKSGCPGDVFSFGLVAMFVALEGNWDMDQLGPREGRSVERRCDDIEKALQDHYLDLEHGICDESKSTASFLQSWNELLTMTVTSNPVDRLTTDGLGEVRRRITGQDPFWETKKHLLDRLVPLRGMKGWSDERESFNLWSRIGAIPRRQFDKSRRSIMTMLPNTAKLAIIKDIDTLPMDLGTMLGLRRAQDSRSLTRQVGILFLRLLTGNETGGVYVQGESRSRSRGGDLASIGAMAMLHRRAWNIGTRFSHGGDDVSTRPLVWQLLIMGEDEAAIRELRENPGCIRQVHLGWTITHRAALEGHVEILREILRLDPDTVEAMTALGAAPLLCAASGKSSGSTDCVRLLLEKGADVHHVALNGDTAIDFLYTQMVFVRVQDVLPAGRLLRALFHLLLSWASRARDHYGQPQTQIGARMRRELAPDKVQGDLEERVEMLRRHSDPRRSSKRSIQAACLVTMYAVDHFVQQVAWCFCAACLGTLLVCSMYAVDSVGSLVAKLIGIVAYERDIHMLSAAVISRGRDPDLPIEQRWSSVVGVIALHFMTTDECVLFTLLPVCLSIVGRRVSNAEQRVLGANRWMKDSSDAPLKIERLVWDMALKDAREVREFVQLYVLAVAGFLLSVFRVVPIASLVKLGIGLYSWSTMPVGLVVTVCTMHLLGSTVVVWRAKSRGIERYRIARECGVLSV